MYSSAPLIFSMFSSLSFVPPGLRIRSLSLSLSLSLYIQRDDGKLISSAVEEQEILWIGDVCGLRIKLTGFIVAVSVR